MPIATEKLWVALGAAESARPPADQPIREAGAWGVAAARHVGRTGSRRCSRASSRRVMTLDRPSARATMRRCDRPERLRARAAQRRQARRALARGARAARGAGLRQPRAPRDRRRRRAAHARRAARARRRGRACIGVVQAGGDIESSVWSADAAASHPRVLAAVAIHPNEAPAYAEAGRLDEAIAVIDELAAQPRVRAIGETGLDFFRTEEDGIPAQFEASRRTSRWRRSTASRCRSTTATPTTPCSRRSSGSVRPSARCSTASRATTPWPGSAPSAATTCRSRATSRSRTRRTCATRSP